MTDASDKANPWRFCTAPCMDWTDRHCRYFWRLLSKRARVYTEMVTTGAIIHGDVERHLRFNDEEHPVALQLGGADPTDLAHCAGIGESYGYDEINLNCGCPSDRVQNGQFGASLMREPERVRDCVAAMSERVDIPVTVKHRLGLDDEESYDALADFVGTVAEGGCEVFIAHARNAWLEGLSPKENREIPPLRYDWVLQLKADFPALTFVLNGGITSIEECGEHLKSFDGVMLGRAAYQNPWLLSDVDPLLFGDERVSASREAACEQLYSYIVEHERAGGRPHHVLRHILGLYQRQPGGKQFRRKLSISMHGPNANADVLKAAVAVTQRPQPIQQTA